MPDRNIRQTLCLDRGWLFHMGDIESPVPHTHIAAYMNHKAGWARGAARYNYDDSDWRSIDLPHDWSVEGDFDQGNHPNAGFLPRGVAWYRRYFRLDEADRGKYLAIRFDGVATHATVYVNGHLLHRNFNGYTPFTVDISDVASFVEQLNVIAVRVDATYMEGWWYEGAGIYRHTWLIKTAAVHVDAYGTFVCPQKTSQTNWDTKIETTLVNSGAAPAKCKLRSQIFDAAGQLIGQARSELTIEPRASVCVAQNAPVKSPALWSLESRNLYRLKTEVTVGTRVVDDYDTAFGYRTIRFDAANGFFLNELPVKLLGTCNHQDHAGVGVAVPDAVHRFRIGKLLQMGSNAFRAAHNPPASELLDACDELGMLVMDENRTFGSSPEVLEQLRTMIRRDRNHPCVILWSICNEESIQTTEVSGRIAQAMATEVKKLDTSRPVTAAVSGGILNEGCIGDQLDVMSINYQLPAHDQYHAKHRTRPLVAGETHCVLSTRGVYKTDESAGVFASDDSAVHPWGATARETWRFIRERPFIAGLFAWTGFDYRGEPAPPRWPVVCSQLGMLDQCGFEEDSFYLHRAWWAKEPFVHLSPHWNHKAGETIRVRADTNCDSVELFLSGKSLGRAQVDPIEMAAWQVKFEPGELKAVAYRGDAVAATTIVQTAGAAAALRLTPSPEGGGEAASLVVIEAVDAQNRAVPVASHPVTLKVEGDAKILGVGNGNPTRLTPDKSDTIALFNGLAQVILEVNGEAMLHASSGALAPVSLPIQAPAPAKPQAFAEPVKKRHFITDWRRSPVTKTRPDPNVQLSDSDMNTWERITIGSTGAAPIDGYAIYRATFTLPKSMQSAGAVLRFEKVAGEIEVFVDGVSARKRGTGSSSILHVEIAGSPEKRTLWVLLHGNSAAIAGHVELLDEVKRNTA